MKILVTGGVGLIGHNVVIKLKELGHEVAIIDTLTNYGIIPEEEIKYLTEKRFEKMEMDIDSIYQIDIVDPAIDDIFDYEQPDIVIHMASFPRQKVVNANPQIGARTMCEGLLNLLEASVKHDVRKFVYISSSMVYGEFTKTANEEYDCKPEGQYGIMKYEGEKLVKDYERKGLLKSIIFRPSAVYGPLDVEDRVISKFLLTAMRGGTLNVNGKEETLDFTYVDDAADGIVQGALTEQAYGWTFNITKSHAHTLYEAANWAVELAGKGTINVREKDADFPSRSALDITKAQAIFGFDPKVDVKEGFKLYYDWLSNDPYWQKKIKKESI